MSDIVSQRKLSVHKEHELLGRLEAAGLADPEAQMVIESKGNELAQRVVAFIRRGGHDASTDQKLARAIMGSAAIFPEDVTELMKVRFSANQLTQLESIPFTEATLREVRDTHVLIAGYPLSILDIGKKVPHLFYARGGGWYANEAFARKKVRLAWHLVRRDVVPGSTSKTFQEQTALLGSNDFVPRASEMTYAAILGLMATGKRIPENVYGRCEDIDSYGYRVYVGFDSGGFSVSSYGDDGRFSHIGLAAARKS